MRRAAISIFAVLALAAGCDRPRPSAPSAKPAPAPPAALPKPSPEAAPEFKPTPANLTRVQHMVGSILTFTLFHELGHMVFHEYKVPMTGKQEDAADRFATALLTPSPRPAGAGPETFDPAVEPDVPPILWAITFWRFMHTARQDAGEAPAYDDEHSLDEQRVRATMCLLYGADPERWEKPFGPYLSEARRPGCIPEARENMQTWKDVLARTVPSADDVRYTAVVRYEDAPPQFAQHRAWLKESGVLELIATEVNGMRYPGPVPPRAHALVVPDLKGRDRIGVVASPCLQPDGTYMINAMWDPLHREITVCYAFVAFLDGYAARTIAKTSIGQKG